MYKFITALLFIMIATASAADDVRIVMSTSEGNIEIELYVDRAPVTAGNFLKLIDNGELDGGSFYRVVSYANDRGSPRIEVIQGGRANRLFRRCRYDRT